MPSVALTFQVHLSYVIRNYSVFDRNDQYFDIYRTGEQCRRYAVQSVLPTHRILLSLLRKYKGRFRFNCAISGTALDLFGR